YTGMSRYEREGTSYLESPEDQARCESIVDLVDAQVADRGITVLDVGCSTGALLAAFDRRGYVDVEGLDPSPACAVFARRVHGIDVRTGSAADLAGLPGRYGLVILSAVLEHLLDPLQVLRDAWRVVAEGGLLFVEVPDVEGFAAGAVAPFQEFSVEHINFFSAESLTSMMAEAGFECAVVERRLIPWMSNALAPAIHAVFRRAANVAPWVADDVTEAALLDYIAESERIEAEVRARIKELADRGRPVLVWGVGTHTRHLLQSGALDDLRVAAWVDSDPKYEGAMMRGVPVIGPEAVRERSETILVSSGTVHLEIARQIHEDLGITNEVVLLYR
ncbi:MAG: methyltransferase domain-containing protein, partial [Candidatus Limnocylindrales bacterium]